MRQVKKKCKLKLQKHFPSVAKIILTIFSRNYIPSTVTPGSIEGCPVGTGIGILGIEVC